MTSARELLFVLVRQRFTASHRARVEEICRQSTIDWKGLVRMAATEGVAPIAGVNLAACDPAQTRVPRIVTERLQAALFENVAFKAARGSELAGQVIELDSRGYDVLLLKSAALEATGVYAQPWVTSAVDLDILVKPRPGISPRPEDVKYRQVLNDTYGVENGDHTTHHDLSLNGVVRFPLDDVWAAARGVQLDGVPALVYVTCPEDLLFTLCLNSCRKRYFRLKALFDVAETVAHYPELDWQRFAARVRASDSAGVVFAALSAADQTLGLPSEAREHYTALLGRARAMVLRSAVRVMRDVRPRHRHVTLTALQYASFTGRQRWRSARLSAWNSLPTRTQAERVSSRLPGE